jgi:hypothetical protein
LSPDGHKQAEALKNFLIGYRQQQLENGNDDKQRPLTVSEMKVLDFPQSEPKVARKKGLGIHQETCIASRSSFCRG